MTIATASADGKPWNTPVYTAFDEQYNFYWVSYKENQHSKNIAENPQVFIVIYDSTVEKGEGAGVYIQANIAMLEDPSEISRAASYYYGRKNQIPRTPDQFLGDMPRRMYKAVPVKVWSNGWDDVKKVDFREEVHLV